jgi:hypothetical protein
MGAALSLMPELEEVAQHDCGPTFRGRCSVSCSRRQPRSCSSGCSLRRRRSRKSRSGVSWKKVSSKVGKRVGPRDYRAAQRIVLGLHRGGRMNEAALAVFSSDNKYDETVAALASLAKVPVSVADRLMAGDRPDPVLILCKAAGLGWATAKAVISVQPDGNAPSCQGLDYAFANYERLSATTAQRVVRFWQVSRNT